MDIKDLYLSKKIAFKTYSICIVHNLTNVARLTAYVEEHKKKKAMFLCGTISMAELSQLLAELPDNDPNYVRPAASLLPGSKKSIKRPSRKIVNTDVSDLIPKPRPAKRSKKKKPDTEKPIKEKPRIEKPIKEKPAKLPKKSPLPQKPKRKGGNTRPAKKTNIYFRKLIANLSPEQYDALQRAIYVDTLRLSEKSLAGLKPLLRGNTTVENIVDTLLIPHELDFYKIYYIHTLSVLELEAFRNRVKSYLLELKKQVEANRKPKPTTD